MEEGSDFIPCPQNMELPRGSSLISAVYGDLTTGQPVTARYLSERVILAPQNEQVVVVNDEVLRLLPGKAHVFLSADSADDETAAAILVEFLNSLQGSGLPPHRLLLKVGAPIMLLRNLDPLNGLCNGTRLIVRRLRARVLEAEIITGRRAGDSTFIPRITLISDKSALPFEFRRRQFPMCIAYAMTINKAQGQTLRHVGLHLTKDVFSHGQLYVAFSRATNPENIKVKVLQVGRLCNVVYDEALLTPEEAERV